MPVRLQKPWIELTEANLLEVKGHLGVYQLGDAVQGIRFIGVADARSLFGLRGELEDALRSGRYKAFRYEVNSAYQTRYRELLMVYVADHGMLPPENDPSSTPALGRLSPG